jgi:SAM-dependent methyltransferase
MTHGFDKDYWQTHWQEAGERETGWDDIQNPYLVRETRSLPPGTALDAGCGEGAEALWLAAAGWQVTAADISSAALALAGSRATPDGAANRVKWVEADLSSWAPDTEFDLVTTHYAHPAMPQLAFYQRISDWVAPGGTLLIVGHLHTARTAAYGHGHGANSQAGHSHNQAGHSHSQARHGQEGHSHQPPEEASATAASITAVLDNDRWEVVTAQEHTRTVTHGDGRTVELQDVVVRATRRP